MQQPLSQKPVQREALWKDNSAGKTRTWLPASTTGSSQPPTCQDTQRLSSGLLEPHPHTKSETHHLKLNKIKAGRRPRKYHKSGQDITNNKNTCELGGHAVTSDSKIPERMNCVKQRNPKGHQKVRKRHWGGGSVVTTTCGSCGGPVSGTRLRKLKIMSPGQSNTQIH